MGTEDVQTPCVEDKQAFAMLALADSITYLADTVRELTDTQPCLGSENGEASPADVVLDEVEPQVGAPVAAVPQPGAADQGERQDRSWVEFGPLQVVSGQDGCEQATACCQQSAPVGGGRHHKPPVEALASR